MKKRAVAMNQLLPQASHDKLLDHFAKYLKDRGIRSTSARRKVLEASLQLREHFEIEQVVYLLKEQGAKVGKATVYRTMPLLVDCGILKQVRFDVKQAHYELAIGEDPHDHMVCRRCGRIVEFGAEEVVELRNRLSRRHRFHAISHRFQISGLCWECSTACPLAASSPAGGAARPVRQSERTSRR